MASDKRNGFHLKEFSTLKEVTSTGDNGFN